MDVQLESFKNPVTGEEQDTKIQIPKGFIWKLAEAAKSKIMRISTPNLNLPMLVLIAPSHLLFASGNPKHCHGYALLRHRLQ